MRLALLLTFTAGFAFAQTPGTVRTFATASPDSLVDLIAFGSCAGQDQSHEFWDVIGAHDPDLFLMLGDNVYADTGDMQEMRAAYEKMGAYPTYAYFRERIPLFATWDDHDYGFNDSGAEFDMRGQAQMVFLEAFGEPADSPRWTRPGIYDAHILGPAGQRVQIILLDTRYFRGPLARKPEGSPGPGRYAPTADTSVTMLGDAQWAWLEEQLRQPADVRFIGSSIQFVAAEHGFEKWANMPHERDRLVQLIADTGAKNVVFLSGDRHLAEISALPASEAPYTLYDVTSSSFNRPGRGSNAEEPNRYRISEGNYSPVNYGLVHIDWEAEAFRFEIRNALSGETVLAHSAAMGE
ncbi:MAG: alkaline phosphatase D family protein [Bacteroidota bacterium]